MSNIHSKYKQLIQLPFSKGEVWFFNIYFLFIQKYLCSTHSLVRNKFYFVQPFIQSIVTCLLIMMRQLAFHTPSLLETERGYVDFINNKTLIIH
jgi:hypothetical protein